MTPTLSWGPSVSRPHIMRRRIRRPSPRGSSVLSTHHCSHSVRVSVSRAPMSSPSVVLSGLASPALARPAPGSLPRAHPRLLARCSAQAGSAAGRLCRVRRGGARRFPVCSAAGGGAGENLCGFSRCCLKLPCLILSACCRAIVGRCKYWLLVRFRNCYNVTYQC